MGIPRLVTVTIPSGGTTPTSPIVMGEATMLAFITPAALTSNTMTFTTAEGADDSVVPVYDSAGNQVSVTITTSRAYTLTGSEADALAPLGFIWPVLNAAEGAERTIYCWKK